MPSKDLMPRAVAVALALLVLHARPAAADDPPLREALRAATSISLARRPPPSLDGRAEDLPVHVVALTAPADVAPVVSALTGSWVEPAHVPAGSGYELEVQRDGALLARGRLVLFAADDGSEAAFLVILEPTRHTVALSPRVAALLRPALDGTSVQGSPCPRCGAQAFVVSTDEGLACRACGEAWPRKRPAGR